MRNTKMIVTDLDRTLLRGDKTISGYTKTVFDNCRESGFLIVFATARPERATRQWQMDRASCYVIANNGATITHGGNEIRNTLISEATKNGIIEQCLRDKNITGICVETGGFLYSNDNDHSSWGTAYTEDAGWNLVYNDFSAPVAEAICKLSVECADSGVVLGIVQNYPELRVFPNNGEYWHQITHKSASKYNAVEYLSHITGIAPGDVIAFGDDYNDVEMLKKCGFGVAVGNAVAAAKEAADFVCGTNDDDGVAKFIDTHLL